MLPLGDEERKRRCEERPHENDEEAAELHAELRATAGLGVIVAGIVQQRLARKDT